LFVFLYNKNYFIVVVIYGHKLGGSYEMKGEKERLIRTISGKTGNDTYQVPRLDASTHAWNMIGYSHHEIHSGKSYTYDTNAAGASGTKATVTFTTPAGPKEIHMLVHFRSNVEAIYTFGEGPTITADTGTNEAPIARNRNNVVASGLIGTKAVAANNVTYGATVTGFGTVLEMIHFGSGKSGGEEHGSDEWVLKPATTYAIEVESEAASSEVMVEMDWYEHTPKGA
jgi:hypothetical protein